MAGLPAKREEPMNLTGRPWEIPRQGPYNWRSKVATPGQYPGPADRERRKWKSNDVTHVFFFLGGNPDCRRYWEHKFYWRNQRVSLVNGTRMKRQQGNADIMDAFKRAFKSPLEHTLLPAHCFGTCTRSDCWISLEGWHFCVKLRLLHALFRLPYVSISQRFLLPPGYSGLFFHLIVHLQEQFKNYNFATALWEASKSTRVPHNLHKNVIILLITFMEHEENISRKNDVNGSATYNLL